MSVQMSASIRTCRMTNAELEQAARLFTKHGPAYRIEVERIEELIDRRRAMGYDPEPIPDPERNAENERRRQLVARYAETVKQEPPERKSDHEPKKRRTKRSRA